MGLIVLWIELLAASCLMVAVAVTDAARGKQTPLRWVVITSGVLFPLGCWAAVTFITIWLQMGRGIGPVSRSLFLLAMAGIFIFVATVILLCGLRNRRAASWPVRKLNLVFVVACALSLMTFWNLDLSAKNQIGRLRARAASIVVATFPPRIPDGRNAARIYEQAFKSLGIVTEKETIVWAIPVCKWLDSPQADSSTARPSDAEIREILKSNALGLKQLRRASAMQQCNFVEFFDWTDLMGALLTQVSSMQSAAELLATDARMRIIDGDLPGAIADINALLAMSEHITRDPTIMTALASISVETHAVETLKIVLANNNITASEVSSLRIDPLFSHGRMVRWALRGEEVTGLSGLASLDGSAYRLLNSRYLPGLLIPLYRVFLMDDEVQAHETAVRAWQELASMPYHQTREKWKTLSRRLMKRQTGFLATSTLSCISKYPERAAEGDAKHRLACLAVAITLYRIKTGALPESLDKLTPEFIEAVPTDPFNGEPLRMIVNKDGGAVLYSIGPDIKDNTGAPMDNGKRTGDITFRLAPKN
jgi:hypothetical protein